MFWQTVPWPQPLAREWCSNNFILRTRAPSKPWTSFPDLSAMSSFRRSLITWSPGFTSGDYDTNRVTAGLDMLEIGARQLNDWQLHAPQLPSLLPARCSAQHAYFISCCHVITPDYLVGTTLFVDSTWWRRAKLTTLWKPSFKSRPSRTMWGASRLKRRLSSTREGAATRGASRRKPRPSRTYH